jgi:hypothetical protein
VIAARGQRRIVRHQDQGRAGLAVELEHQRHHRLAGREVEAAGRFVGQQQRRPNHEGARQRDALLLASRQHARIVAQPLAQADAAQHLGGQCPGVGAALELERQHHVLERIEIIEQLEALEDEADLGGAHGGTLVLADREQVDAVEPHRAGGRRVEPGDQREQGALARSRGADDRHRALPRQGEIDLVENRQRAGRVLDALGQALDGDDRFGHEGRCALRGKSDAPALAGRL